MIDISAFATTDVPSTLYHYTSPQGLIGITQSKSMWASNIKYLNDAQEFTLAIQVLREVLSTFEDHADPNWLKSVFERTEIYLQKLEGDAFVNEFVCSFSEAGDLLSQWRGYCPSGCGYSIGFHGEHLTQVAEENGFILAQCVYQRDEQLALVRRIIQSVLGHELLAGIEKLRDDVKAAAVDRATSGILVTFLILGALIKDSAFAEEREWRLVTSGLTGKKPLGTLYRPGKSMLIPYLSFPLTRAGEDLAYAEVVVGPTPHPGLAKEVLRKFLKHSEASCGTLRLSDAPFRDW